MTITPGAKQLLACDACGQVFYRDYLPARQALLSPLAQHRSRIPQEQDRDCLGSGSLGTLLGIEQPPKEAKAV